MCCHFLLDGGAFATWPRDCADIRKVGPNVVSNVYRVFTHGPALIPVEITVYCDMDSSDSGWLVSTKTGIFY